MDCSATMRPLGMARILETLLSVISFACTVNFHGSASYSITCPAGASGTMTSLEIEWRYPFWLTATTVDAALCNSSQIANGGSLRPVFFVDFGVQAQFFVFVGVCSFLISLIWVIVYAGFWRAYAMDTLLPTTDLVISIIAALLWLCADCAWASAYSTLQSYVGEPQITRSINAFPFCQNGGKCVLEAERNEFGTGGFGLTLGFVNCLMWVLNAFLAYREQQKIKFERDRLMYTADAFRPQATPSETMDATSINSRAGFRAI